MNIRDEKFTKMVLLYTAAALVTVAFLLYKYFTRTFNYWKARNVVGPEPVAFFGNLKESTLRRKNLGVVYKEIYDSYPNEKVVGIYRMTTPCLLIRDLNIIKHIMIKDFDMFVDRGVEFSKEGLGNNLFHADGDTWRVLRNKFTPIFTSGKLKNMLYLLTERGDKFSDYVDSICQQSSEQEVYSLVQKFTMSTISACAFGLDIDTLGDKLSILNKIDKLIFSLNYASELDMMYPGILKKLNSSLFPTFVKGFFADLVKDVVTQRNGVPSDRKDFMDLILEMRQQGEIQSTKRSNDSEQLSLKITDDVIAAQAFVFYAAGYETSATTMTFMLYELALNPDVQDKLHAEIIEVLEKYDGKITYDALNEMNYMGMVFDETLRKYPILDPLLRNAQCDYKIPGTDITITKGQTVLLSPTGIQHDEKHYENPSKFDPERFSPDAARNRHPCAYLPFGVGPRNCIGMRFAKVQSKVCIMKLLSSYQVRPSQNTPKVIDFEPKRVVIGPTGGINLNLYKIGKVNM